MKKLLFARRTLNQLLAIHFSVLGLLLLGWLLVGGPVFQKLIFFYAFFGWLPLRLWNRWAWKRHFRPRDAR